MDFLEMMRTVWDDSLDGIIVSDIDTKVIDVNPAYCRMTGYSRDQLIGAQANLVRSGLTPRPVFEAMWQVLGSSGKWVGELINQRPDGALWISFLSITRVVGPDNTPVAYVGIARDLTDRRDLEDQLRHQSTRLGALLEAIVSGVAMFDPAGRCAVVNHSLTNLLRCSADDLIGCTRAQLQDRLKVLFREDDLLAPTQPMGTRGLTTQASTALLHAAVGGGSHRQRCTPRSHLYLSRRHQRDGSRPHEE
jgi:PAS domain S-box-containing protein